MSTTEFMALASRATDAFVTTGVDLNEAIAKLASDRDLSPVQIQRVVELTNHETHERLRKTAEDKTFTFPLASVDEVLGHLRPGTGHQKVASLRVQNSMRSYIGRESANTAVMEKAAEAVESHPFRAQIRVKTAAQHMQKIAGWLRTHRTQIESRRTGLHEDIREELAKLAQLAKNHIANGGRFSDLHKLACNYDRDSGRMWDVLFGRVRDSLMKTASASPMVAALKRDKLSPSDEVPVEVINGGHKLLIGLDTLKNKICAEDLCSRRLRLMDNHGPAVIAYIKELSSSSDVEKHILEDITKVAELASDEDQLFAQLEKFAGIVGGALKAVGSGSKLRGAARLTAAGSLGLAGVAAYRGVKGSASAATEATRPWRPGAHRGADEGGDTEAK